MSIQKVGNRLSTDVLLVAHLRNAVLNLTAHKVKCCHTLNFRSYIF